MKRLPILQEKLKTLEDQISKITDFSLSDYAKLQKEFSKLKDEESLILSIISLDKNIDENQKLQEQTNDEELLQLAKQEFEDLNTKKQELMLELTNEPIEQNNVIIEIRSGAGGEEASLFAQNLFRLYTLFAKEMDWTIELIDTEYTDDGGIKYLNAYIRGKNVYKWLRYESGVHRVQRIPATESSGRIHTSTSSIAILPEANDDINIELKDSDLELQTFRSSGPGGQYVNKTCTAVRIKHIPSGITVASQTSKSQAQNRVNALNLIKAQLYEIEYNKIHSAQDELRRNQIGTNSRSEKIRTYNFPQNRLTDHRIKVSWYNLVDIMNGKIKNVLSEISQEMKLLSE